MTFANRFTIIVYMFCCVITTFQSENAIEYDFNLKTDVLVFLHIQKTSGTFWNGLIEKHLLGNDEVNGWQNVCLNTGLVQIEGCFIAQVLFRRKSGVFWNRNEKFGCDIHAGYTELSACLQKDTLVTGAIHMFTMLRRPEERYVSEFEHVKKGAIWSQSIRMCVDKPLYTTSCYEGHKDWTHVTWSEFLTCEHNLANNRQVRMLADYAKLGCQVLKCWVSSANCSEEEKTLNDEMLLESAKDTLLSLSFFGLTEFQELSKYLFVKMFPNKFKFSSVRPKVGETIGLKKLKSNYADSVDVIRSKNALDVKLYEFALKVFFERVDHFRKQDDEQQNTNTPNTMNFSQNDYL